MIENFIMNQLTFAEIFVPQDFTIRTTPGLSGPANTYGWSSLQSQVLAKSIFLDT